MWRCHHSNLWEKLYSNYQISSVLVVPSGYIIDSVITIVTYVDRVSLLTWDPMVRLFISKSPLTFDPDFNLDNKWLELFTAADLTNNDDLDNDEDIEGLPFTRAFQRDSNNIWIYLHCIKPKEHMIKHREDIYAKRT